MVAPTRTRMSADEYIRLPEYAQHTLIQLIDGEVVVAMPPTLKHQDIVREILILLSLIARRLGGKAYAAPVEVRLDDQHVLEPDVLYIAPGNLGITRQDDKRIMGAPDLVVEVLSPGTARYDRQQKFQAYQRHGVAEYWIIDPLHDTIEVWTAGEGDGGRVFRLLGAFAGDDTFTSVVLGESIRVAAIFEG